MNEYPKKYEDVYSGERSRRKCNIDMVSSDRGHTGIEFADILKKEIVDYQSLLFDKLVKISWLIRRFCYGGYRRKKSRFNGVWFDGAFGSFIKNYICIDPKNLTSNAFTGKIIGYLDDFFPDFDARNPFEEKMEFPFKNITLDFLVPVYQLPDRMEFLALADKKRLTYAEFLDYLINYFACESELGNDDFFFKVNKSFAPYVSKIKKYERRKHKRRGRPKKT